MSTVTIIGWVLSVMTSLFLIKGSTDKLRGTDEMVANFAYMKLGEFRIHVGLGELLGAILLLIPVTSLYGAILIACFMSAAVALHLSLMGGAKTNIPTLVGLATVLGYILRTL